MGKKLTIVILVAILSIATLTACRADRSAGFSNTEVFFDDGDFIRAEGMTLKVGEEKILLKGVNLGGWLMTEDWMCPTTMDSLSSENGQYELEDALTERLGKEKKDELFEIYRENWITEKDFEFIKSLGFNCVRLPFGWRDFTDENGEFHENAFKYTDLALKWCKKYSLYLILDLHGAYGSQNGRHHSGDTREAALYGNEKNEKLTRDLWVEIAKRYKDEKVVAGYDLLNEPEGYPGGKTSKVQFDYYDVLYKAIREEDENHLLFLEACWDVPQMTNPKNYGWENVCYEYHYYDWGNENDLSATKKFLTNKALMESLNRLSFKVPVFIGEFTCFDNLDCWDYELDFFEENDMSWTVWTYKGCVGGNWTLINGYERTTDNVVTPETSYERAKEIFSSLSTDNFRQNQPLIDFFKEYFSK